MGSNPSGSRPNSFGRQHLTFDKGGKGDGDFRWIVLFWRGWREARMVKYFTAWALIIIGL